MAPLLQVDGLCVAFRGEDGASEVLSGVSFEIGQAEILGIVGESGSGKSVTALAVMRLLGGKGDITAGDIRLNGVSLPRLDAETMRQLRGRSLAMIFQEPMTSLNPLLRIGFQIEEVLLAHLGLGRQAARERAISLLDQAGVPDAAMRCRDYPHQLSGGMRQRVMIAMAMACAPALLIADEPTTALDVTIQAQILQLVKRMRLEHGSSVLLITHDIGVIARMADRIAVMYAGQIVETASARALLTQPGHPYTRLLLASVPATRRKQARLPVIPGQMPLPGRLPAGCRFSTRCPEAADICRTEPQALRQAGPQHSVRCWRAAVAQAADA